MTRIAMGGTFDVLHAGHRVLLETAFRDGREIVRIGVTSDALANASRARVVRPQAARAGDVLAFLRARGFDDRGSVAIIDHAFGFALEPEWDTIVVTEETMANAERINAERVARRLPALAVRVAPLVLADDGRPVRATRVVGGEVDAEGRLLRPPVVVVGSENPVKIEGARRAFERRWPKVVARGVAAASGVGEQPIGARATWAGAEARARAALAAAPDADFGVGVEAGMIEEEGRWFDVQAAVVVDAGGRVTRGRGPGFQYPREVTARVVEQGRSVGDVLGEAAGDPALGRREGAIGWLTRGALDRAGLTGQAVLAALVPRFRVDFYGFDAPGNRFS